MVVWSLAILFWSSPEVTHVGPRDMMHTHHNNNQLDSSRYNRRPDTLGLTIVIYSLTRVNIQ